MQTAVIAEKGLRPAMEDTHYLDTNFAGTRWIFGGIYDGHGGKAAADYAARRLHRVFQKQLGTARTPQQAFTETYELVSSEMRLEGVGATAVNFLIGNNQIITANVGDARAIVIGEKDVRQLTVDHRLDNPEERQRVERMGGQILYPYVYRGNQGLMPTRSLGDEYFRPVGVIPTPSVNSYDITSDDFMFLAACDGLFDFMSNEEVAAFARRSREPVQLLQELKQEVLSARSGTDNLTIIAVSLR